MLKSRKIKTNKNDYFEGPIIITPRLNEDERGYFFESWNQKEFNTLLKKEIKFVQINQSFSKLNVLRGMHYQINPFAQGKLLKVSYGKIFDVIVDLRTNSKTFCQWGFVNLDNIKNEQIWIPEGFAHGFLTLSEKVIVEYKVTNYWHKDAEKSLKWDDPQINIEWPIKEYKKNNLLISSKDLSANSIQCIIKNNLTFK